MFIEQWVLILATILIAVFYCILNKKPYFTKTYGYYSDCEDGGNYVYTVTYLVYNRYTKECVLSHPNKIVAEQHAKKLNQEWGK